MRIPATHQIQKTRFYPFTGHVRTLLVWRAVIPNFWCSIGVRQKINSIKLTPYKKKRWLPKPKVVGSIPITRSNINL